jgi:hypothetical protein
VPIAGTANADTVYLKKNADGTHVDFWLNAATPGVGTPTGQLLASGPVIVQAGGGNDVITVDNSAGQPVGSTGIQIDGGAGTNTITANGGGGTTAESLTVLNTGGGTDNLSFTGGVYSLTTGKVGAVSLANSTVTLAKQATHATRTTLEAASLTLDAASTLDIMDNDVIVHTAAGGEKALETLVGKGNNGGDYKGKGITSSLAANDAAFNTTVGIATAGDIGVATFGRTNTAVTGNDSLIKYTYYGDFDLSGSTTGDDEQLILTGLRVAGTPQTYVFGDADFSGKVNGDDYSLFLQGHRKTPAL